MLETMIIIANTAYASVFSYRVHDEFSLLREFNCPKNSLFNSYLIGVGHHDSPCNITSVPADTMIQSESERFVHELADWLDIERKNNHYLQVMVVAEPGILNMLKDSIGYQSMHLVFKPLDKDYSKINQRDLPRMLGLAS